MQSFKTFLLEKKKEFVRRNPIAKDLFTPKYAHKVVKMKTLYNRKKEKKTENDS